MPDVGNSIIKPSTQDVQLTMQPPLLRLLLHDLSWIPLHLPLRNGLLSLLLPLLAHLHIHGGHPCLEGFDPPLVCFFFGSCFSLLSLAPLLEEGNI